MALTSLKLSHIQLVFKQLVLLYSIRHVYRQGVSTVDERKKETTGFYR